MSQGPRRLIEDPEWGGAFEGLLDEHGKIEGLPDDVRGDVALMIAASVAGAVGIAAAGATVSSLASAGSTAGATGSVSSMLAGGVGSASATAAASSVAAGGGAVAGSGLVAVGSSVASVAGTVTAASTLGAASASLAALGVVPKIIAVLSLAGAVTAGGVVVVKEAQNSAQTALHSHQAAVYSHQAEVHSHQAESGERKNKFIPRSPPFAQPKAALAPADEKDRLEDRVEGLAFPGAPAVPGAPALKNIVAAQPSQAKPGGASGLAGEVSLLRRARSALSVNREYAWTLLTEYHRRYPEGALRAEYEALVRRVQTTPGEDESQVSTGEGAPLPGSAPLVPVPLAPGPTR